VRFHDDTPVTADVVAAILRVGEFDGFEAVKKIEAPDPQTILFRLTRRDGFLPSALAGAMIVDSKKPDIGTGPFRLVPQSDPLEAIRNTSYYRGQPGIERIQVRPYATPRASWVGLMKGDVDMALEISRESVSFWRCGTVQRPILPFSLITSRWFSTSATPSWRGLSASRDL
jgi:MarR-like DNA-binding transcriptional regulator SgrR of sgrS sRNA